MRICYFACLCLIAMPQINAMIQNKLGLFIVVFTISAFGFTQNLLMQNGTFTRCSGTFTDTGGDSVGYSNNENLTITICPDTPLSYTQLDFSEFNLEDGSDFVSIYDGDSTSQPLLGTYSGLNSPGIILATSTNASGCLTVQFQSDGSGTRVGWNADISCVNQCQTILSQIDSSFPLPNSDGYIRVCPDEDVTLVGSGIFSLDGGGASYEWDLGNGTTVVGQTATFSYPDPGVYIVNLNIRDNNTAADPNGCPNTNLLNQVIQVGTEPDFNGTQASISDICFGETVTIEGRVSPTDFTIDCTPPVSDETFLPDGNGVSYETSIVVDCFNSDQTITDISDIQSICLNMEHSYVSDLTIRIISPNGQQVILHNRSGGASNLGIPWATGTFDGSSSVTTPGVGYDYCFVPGNSNPLLGDTSAHVNSNFPLGDGPDSYSDTGVPAGDYSSAQPLDGLIGSPLNGEWTIRVTDNVTADNGYIFEWGIEFNAAIQPAELSFTPSIITEGWDPDPSIITVNGNEITVRPDQSGQNCYTYRVLDDFGCEYTEQVCINVAQEIEFVEIGDQINCDFDGDGFSQFNLTDLISSITPVNATNYNVSFHLSESDANSNSNSLPGSFTNTVPFQSELIFVRIQTNDFDCFETFSFEAKVFDNPQATPVEYVQCDNSLDGDDSNGFAVFDLFSRDAEVLNGLNPSDFAVSYYRNQADADLRDNPIISPYTNTVVNADQVVARVENIANTDCYGTAVMDIVVEPLPSITLQVELFQCDTDTDGFTDFNLTESEELISINFQDEIFTYHTSLADAESGTNAIVNPQAYTNTDSSSNADELYVRVSTVAGCFRIAQLDLLVSTTAIPAGFELVYEICDGYDVDNDNTNGIESFDFSDATAQIEALFPSGQNLTVSYYQSIADALAEVNAIADISNYRNTTSPFEQLLVVRVDSDVDNSCLGLGEHIVLRTVNPQPNTDPVDLIQCDDTTPGDLTELFDLTQNEVYILNGEAAVTASYHEVLEEAEAGINAIVNPTAYANTSPDQTIYVRVTNTLTGCYARVEFNLQVNPLPDTVVVSDLLACENNSDGFFDFDLQSKTAEVLGGQDASVFQVSYHVTQADADNLNNPLASPYTNTTNPQTIYVAITNTLTGCSVSSVNFNLILQEAAEANPDGIPIVYELCDNVNANDGFGQFDLSTQSSGILDGQDPVDFSLTYHSSMEDALNDENPLPLLYENLTNPQVIYARVSNVIAPNECFEVGELTLQVNLLPEVVLEEEYVLCLTTNGTEVVQTPPVIDTGLSGTQYSFQWYYNGDLVTTETAPSIIATQSGTYEVVVTDVTTSTVTSCSASASTVVIDSEVPQLEAEVISTAFSGSHAIQAMATGIGEYEYNLDNGPWQMDGLFDQVTLGVHTISARDRNGCGVASVEVVVMDYPRYFTPNGDGNNDRWQIPGLENQPNSKIYIFDRYGKLLVQLSPTGSGWDGTYNGNLMRSDDYWFSVNFIEPTTGEPKIFKAHFTLKR